MNTVKTLFLSNRQQTEFYLYLTAAEKPSKSKGHSSALGVSPVFIAPAELLDSMLGTTIGAASVFSVLLAKENKVQVVQDEDGVTEEWYGCSDGTTTGFMRVKTDHIVHDFLNHVSQKPIIVKI